MICYSVKQWLELLVNESQDPLLTLSWLPDLSSMKVTVYLHVKLYPNGIDRCVSVFVCSVGVDQIWVLKNLDLGCVRVAMS